MARSHRQPAGGLDLPQFLADFATKYGGDALMGSVLLLRLQREIDDLMSFALGLTPKFHRGHPSPWSHCVLIIEPYQGKDPKILDCTIRDANDNVEWTMSFSEFLSKPLDKQGRIYPGHVSDYEDKRVTLVGIKFMETLKLDERKKIVKKALKLQAKGYHYDIPGMFRELTRFLFGITFPPPNDLLHCSGFCQKAYYDALHRTKGMFDPTVLYPQDATDDEIWYPKRGTPFPPTVPLPPAARKLAAAAPSLQRKRRRR